MIILLNNTLGALHCSDLVVVPGRRHLSRSADLLRRIPLHPFREDLNRKKTFSFGHCPNHLTPPSPPDPIRATWSSFLDVKNDVLRV